MPDVPMLLHELKQESGPKLKKLTKAIASLVTPTITPLTHRFAILFKSCQDFADHVYIPLFFKTQKKKQQIENDPLVAYIPLNIQDEDSISALLTQVDNAMQYGEDLEPKEPKWADAEDEEEDAEK